MDMKVIDKKRMLCTSCMEEHEVKEILIKEKAVFKGIEVYYDACYYYCDKTDEIYMDERQIRDNDLRLKDAYRVHEGLLTTGDIKAIRKKYGITQNDFSIVLGWGEKTITRYESYQVQDRAHDTILKKVDRDPEWFIFLLKNAKDSLTDSAYEKYIKIANNLYEKDEDLYLRKTIEASYAGYRGDKQYNGNTQLSLDKVIDVIRYFAASTKIINLYKVKLMKLMWYADSLSYKLRGSAITGLVYTALPMGAVPVSHDLIINLKGVPCEEVDIGETNAYHFALKGATKFNALTEDDKKILDIVIEKLGNMSKNDIVEFMHNEDAYKKTTPFKIINYKYAETLQI